MIQQFHFWVFTRRKWKRSERYRCPHVHGSTNYNSQDMKATQAPSGGGTSKENAVYTDTAEYYSTTKGKEILPFATTRMDLEGIIMSGISHREKDKHPIIPLTCGIDNKTKQTKTHQTRPYRGHTAGCQVGEMVDKHEWRWSQCTDFRLQNK